MEVLGPVASIQEALQLLQTGAKLDGAVLDVNVRDDMIFPLADLLFQQGVPFIFSTGYEDSVIPLRYLEVTRCRKPIEPSKVVQALFAS